MTRDAFIRIGLIVWITACAVGVGAQTRPRTPTPPKEEPAEVGPATTQTVDKATEAAKDKLPTEAPAMVDPKSYVIGAEDILFIRVWREPELTTPAQVRPDGMITLNLIGEVRAAGMTPNALKEKITEAYSEFINKPEVQVIVQSVLSRKYHITGAISRSGSFPLVIPVTVLEALVNAGGFKEFANTKKVTILRKGKILKFNYNDVIKGKKMEQNVLLEPGDLIHVPE
jgi:polysaccharide export outer membrane protein